MPPAYPLLLFRQIPVSEQVGEKSLPVVESRTPEGMALVAAMIGGLSAIVGLRAAYVFDTPAGPSIVCVAAIIFATTSIIKSIRPAS